MKAIRAGLERYLTQAPHRKAFSIILDKVFTPANEALDSHLKSLAKTGVLSSTKHKPAIEREHLEQLFAAKQLGNDTPESLLQTAWFYLMLYFGKRGRENQRNMVKEDIVFGKNVNGLEYVTLRERATKNHPGGLRDNEDNSQAIMCEWPENPERCPVRCIKKYLEKRNPTCPALWQKPRICGKKFDESDLVWYYNVPLGKNNLDNLLSRMSKKAGLSTHYTSHCIRATSVNILKAAGLENSRVRSVTGHKSDSSIDSYHERPTFQQQVQSSAIVSNFVAPVAENQVVALQNTAQSRSPLAAIQPNHCPDEIRCFSQRSSVGAQQTNAAQNFSSGSFQNCTFNFYGHSA